METPIKKGRNRNNKKVANPVNVTESGNPVIFVTIEEHQKAIDEKITQLISLQNNIRACENSLEKANAKNLELKEEVRKLRQSLTNENLNANSYLIKLNRIPNWIKKLFNA